MGKHTFNPSHLRWENPFNLGHSFCWQPIQDVEVGHWLSLPACSCSSWKVTAAAVSWWSHRLCCVWRVRLPCPSPYLLALAFFLSPSLQGSLNLKESRDLVRVEPSSVIYVQFLGQPGVCLDHHLLQVEASLTKVESNPDLLSAGFPAQCFTYAKQLLYQHGCNPSHRRSHLLEAKTWLDK